MTVKVNIPANLRPSVGNSKSLQVEAGPLNKLLDNLGEQYPDLKSQIFQEDGTLHKFVNVYVNDEDARYLDDKWDTQVEDGDVVAILPAVAGGAR